MHRGDGEEVREWDCERGEGGVGDGVCGCPVGPVEEDGAGGEGVEGEVCAGRLGQWGVAEGDGRSSRVRVLTLDSDFGVCVRARDVGLGGPVVVLEGVLVGVVA